MVSGSQMNSKSTEARFKLSDFGQKMSEIIDCDNKGFKMAKAR